MISGGAGAIAFSPDGQMLASGSGSEPTAFLWNVATRKRIGSMLLPDRRGITALTYALDGKTLAVGYTNGDIALWDTATQQKTALLDTASSVLWTLAFSPNGRLLASGGYKDSTISLWDVQTKTLLGAFDGHTRDTRAQNHGVSTIAFSPDGKTLASGSGFDCTVRLWDVAVRTEIALLLELDTYELEGINSVVFSPNGTLLASASDDAAIRMWDTRTLEQIGVLETRSGGVTSLAFQPDGKRLASLNGRVAATPRHKGGDMAIRLWEVESRKQVAISQYHNASVESVALSPDGTLLAVGCQDGVVELWDIGSRKRIDVMQGRSAMVQCVAFSPDGSLLASSAKEHARLWNIEDRKQIAIFNHTAIVESIAFSSDSKALACVDDNCIRLWDTRRKRAVSVLGEVPLPSQASFRELSLLKTLYLKWIRRESPTDLPVHYASTIQSIAFSPDGKMLISGGIDNAVRLWDIRKRREIFTHKQDQKDVDSANIQAVAFSPGGDIFASAGTHKEIHLWSVAEHKLIGTLNTEEHVEALAFNPDGRFLAAGVRANIRVWDMETLAEVATLEGRLGAVTTFAFSGDGKTLVASAGHGVIRVWDSSGLGSD